MICVHDIIAITGLAVRVSIAYKDVDYRHISGEVAALKLLIDRVAPPFKSLDISHKDYYYGEKVLRDCQSVLEDLNSFVEKYKRLASINRRLTVKGVKLGKDDIASLQVRLISNTLLLNGFIRGCVFHLISPIDTNILSSYEYKEVQEQLAALLSFHSRISVSAIASFAANSNTEMAYMQFCKDLYRIGVTEDIVQQKGDKILAILRSQRMVASSQIGDSDIGDKDQILEKAYKKYCNNLYKIGFTDKMILQQKDEILGILRSQGMVASSKTSGSNTRGKS